MMKKDDNIHVELADTKNNVQLYFHKGGLF